MERNPPKDKLGLGLAFALVAVGLLSLSRQGTEISVASNDASWRDQILAKYGIRPNAIAYVDSFPFQLKPISTDLRGGGMSFVGSHWEVYSHQEEALVHEASHMWSYALMNPAFCSYLDKTISQEPDTYFKDMYKVTGMKDNCTEEYASTSSWDMGVQTKMPPDLQPLYKSFYNWQ